jgi:hypothetical protein
MARHYITVCSKVINAAALRLCCRTSNRTFSASGRTCPDPIGYIAYIAPPSRPLACLLAVTSIPPHSLPRDSIS